MQKTKAIATKKLNIEKLKEHFRNRTVFDIKDLFAFYQQHEKEVKQTTVNWRIYALVQMGILQRIGRGKFSLGESRKFLPEVTPKIKRIYNKVKKEFPYLDICIWNSSTLSTFMLHQPRKFYCLVEVEKEATNTVFYFLRENNFAVFIDPTQDILEKYSPLEKDILIVKSLVSEAPVLSINGIVTASIEKILVDVFCDQVIFSAQQGTEMRTVFNEALHKYTVSHSKMLRYADRRNKKDPFDKFLKSITNLRQQ